MPCCQCYVHTKCLSTYLKNNLRGSAKLLPSGKEHISRTPLCPMCQDSFSPQSVKDYSAEESYDLHHQELEFYYDQFQQLETRDAYHATQIAQLHHKVTTLEGQLAVKDKTIQNLRVKLGRYKQKLVDNNIDIRETEEVKKESVPLNSIPLTDRTDKLKFRVYQNQFFAVLSSDQSQYTCVMPNCNCTLRRVSKLVWYKEGEHIQHKKPTKQDVNAAATRKQVLKPSRNK